MLNYLRKLTGRIPEPYRVAWRTYGPAAVLLASVLTLWLTRGERLIVCYLEGMDEFSTKDKTHISNSTSYAIGYVSAYLAVKLFKTPWHVLPMLGMAWSMAVLLYRYWFRNLLAGSPWYAWVGAVLSIPLVQVPLLASALSAWTGRNDGNLTLSVLLHIWFIAYALWNHLRSINKTRRELTETATQAELTALKAQINPHFLFNSLNNIFGTALTEGGHQTPDGVQRLSGLLRYQLEKAQQTGVDVVAELRFLDDYVQFQRQLLPQPDALTHEYEWDETPATIAPLLLTPLIDYALQHQQPNANVPVTSRLSVMQQFLHYSLTYPAGGSVDYEPLDNLTQRLEKMYPGCHTFKVRPGRLDLGLDIANTTPESTGQV